MAAQPTSIFVSWLDAPFLKELTGKQLYEMMVTIRDRDVTGECECYVENGEAFVLGFVDGQPVFDRDKVSEVLKRPSVVAAWMPGKVVAAAEPDAPPAISPDDAATLQRIIDDAVCFRADHHWLVLLRGTKQVLASEDHAAGVNLATGLAAEINGAFLELTQGRPLQRFSLDVSGTRYGFETLGGDWSTVFCASAISQPDALDCTRRLRTKLTEMGLTEGTLSLASRAATAQDAQYCLVRPQMYQNVEQMFCDWARLEVDAPWNQIWLQYNDEVIFSTTPDAEGSQERGGAFAGLNTMIQQGFERLTNDRATNFVLYADGITVWCDFFEGGFWATRFADDTTGYRKTADTMARKGWSLARAVFGTA